MAKAKGGKPSLPSTPPTTSKQTIDENGPGLSEKEVPEEHAQPKDKKQKGRPGRPKKQIPKAENRTISTDPILFEKYRIICENMNKSLSEFLRQSVEFYCMHNSIPLYDDELTRKAQERYAQHLKEKSKKRQ